MPWVGHSCTAVDSIPLEAVVIAARPGLPVGEKIPQAALPPDVLSVHLKALYFVLEVNCSMLR